MQCPSLSSSVQVSRQKLTTEHKLLVEEGEKRTEERLVSKTRVLEPIIHFVDKNKGKSTTTRRSRRRRRRRGQDYNYGYYTQLMC